MTNSIHADQPSRTLSNEDMATELIKLAAEIIETGQVRISAPFLVAELDGARAVALSHLLVLQRNAEARVARCSQREKQVLRLIAQGAGNKEIANTLGISPRTVEIHRANLYLRLGVASTAQAVRIWFYTELPLAEPLGGVDENP